MSYVADRIDFPRSQEDRVDFIQGNPTVADALTISSTHQWTLYAKKDGVVWDLTGATVTLLFRKPDGTSLTKSATVTDGPNGIAVYAGTTTDLDVIGGWRRSWRVVSGSVDVRSLPIGFSVQATP